MSLAEKAEAIRTQLGLKPGLPIHDIVLQAVDQLGISGVGLNLAQKVDACFAAVSSPPSEPAGAPPVVQGTLLAAAEGVATGTAVVAHASPQPVAPAFNLAGQEPPPFDISAFLGTFQSTKVEWTPVREEDKKKQRVATIMSLRVERQLDANGYLTGRANAMVRVFGFIQKQVPLESQMTITSPTTAQGEGLGNHWTLTVDPQTGTSEAVVRHDDTHQVTMRVTYQKVG